MKKSPILAASALALTLGAVAPIVGIYTGSAYAVVDHATATAVANLSDLNTALADASVSAIYLTADITTTSTIEINHNVEIDLNGHAIRSAGRVFNIRQGAVVFSSTTGTGIVEDTTIGGIAMGVYGSTNVADTNFTNVTIDQNVTLKGGRDGSTDNGYGLIVGPTSNHAYGVNVTMNGTIEATNGLFINGNIQDGETNAPQITIGSTARVDADDATGMAIYGAGYGKWTIGAATLDGATGIGAKAGIFNIDGATINATGANRTISSTTQGMLPNGATFQIDQNGAYADELKININGGTYKSANNSVFSEYGDDSQLKIINLNAVNMTSGTNQPIFSGDIATNIVKIDTAANSTSTFSEISSVTPYLTADQEYVTNADGKFTVKNKTPVVVDPSDDDGKGDAEETVDPSATIPNSGVIGSANGDARATASVMAAVATTLTTIAAGVVVYRNVRRNREKKN